ncbi:MAG: hypothetical protein AAGN82_20550 [Myxococcota bacterium]
MPRVPLTLTIAVLSAAACAPRRAPATPPASVTVTLGEPPSDEAREAGPIAPGFPSATDVANDIAAPFTALEAERQRRQRDENQRAMLRGGRPDEDDVNPGGAQPRDPVGGLGLHGIGRGGGGSATIGGSGDIGVLRRALVPPPRQPPAEPADD